MPEWMKSFMWSMEVSCDQIFPTCRMPHSRHALSYDLRPRCRAQHRSIDHNKSAHRSTPLDQETSFVYRSIWACLASSFPHFVASWFLSPSYRAVYVPICTSTSMPPSLAMLATHATKLGIYRIFVLLYCDNFGTMKKHHRAMWNQLFAYNY